MWIIYFNMASLVARGWIFIGNKYGTNIYEYLGIYSDDRKGDVILVKIKL